ncbi:unnamed protein product (macronuclear) [Paramecium tetraurelia]|uniref:Ribose-5-phosphate isomerase n=1 Tax=Paramecium tetraurelia TaxID=5888 RepID=A0DSW2_PARTE|nr:uncharacterized protein GSPATT00019822001 [Paramecium tetraurelia]CAK86129.1 unnamed protein product [Paramecium tetraurelia]|eukprot:XP_001453526.1 hypothetical protein (macronuclear) [Paramecium tetraurelia strain d4-2]
MNTIRTITYYQFSKKNQYKIYIGNDHAGLEYKNIIIDHLKQQEYDIINRGTNTKQSCDYNEIATELCSDVLRDKGLGILICGSGVGMSIMSNKVKGIRCGQINDYNSAKQAAEIGCNVIALGSRILGIEVAKQVIDAFLNSYQNVHTEINETISQIEQDNFRK